MKNISDEGRILQSASCWQVDANKSVDQAWSELASRLSQKNQSTSQPKGISRHIGSYKMLITGSIAALLCVAIGLFLFSQSNITKTVATADNEKSNIILPDGSFVMLDENTNIEFKFNKLTGKRKVNFEGEAYFRVEKGEEFEILTSKGIVSVLGTSFDVKSNNNSLEVTCHSGKVSVSDPKHGISSQTLTKNHKLTYAKKLHIEQTDLNTAFILNTVPYSQVFKIIEEEFGQEVDYPQRLKKLTFSGTLPVDNLENSLKVVCNTLGLQYLTEDVVKVY
ncbi:FecR family protein [Aureibacter tunicatorum]|uniref:Ferric-dicitrate binding protein FerR (Iron transport regulator) n=1 Tax=Aureibacter tunicatorum TaxID=866807 RepID=A0AAE4BU21_9BACT|nr:FecR family protein [Aureibacter tunicatorum]MDR6240343.1 ferric-dicitrate binding protein FerR (iron transport regulator) [Aureibacter tunicatorum]BDD05776.1 hypothetical protein AUTU_32590 [Aureibacter tunicatorum]